MSTAHRNTDQNKVIQLENMLTVNTIIITADREPILPTIKVPAQMMRDYLKLTYCGPMAKKNRVV